MDWYPRRRKKFGKCLLNPHQQLYYHTLFPVLPCLKTGHIVSTDPLGWRLGRAGKPTRKTQVAKATGRMGFTTRNPHRKRNNHMCIFSWNMHSLYSSNVAQQVADNPPDVTTFQERQTGFRDIIDKKHRTPSFEITLIAEIGATTIQARAGSLDIKVLSVC